jgi:hypothetical protein
MPIFNDTLSEYQIKRWMRPDAQRFLRPDWRRFWKPGHENDPLYRYYESIERKFDPSQPRVPAGSSDGGQWTSGGGDSGTTDNIADTNKVLMRAKQLAAGRSPAYLRCLDLCSPLLERFTEPGSDRNQWDFIKCMDACLGH